jgi:excisionase family DNA binding protein
LEQLLNIREAAEFLNVSEMTIRRWTNQGALKCYRVGGRRARRFSLKDLQAYLEENTRATDSDMVTLGFGDFTVPDGSHITHLSINDDEAMDVAAAFIADGLTKKESICIVTPDSEVEKIVATLERRELDVRRFLKSSNLHFSNGEATPQKQAEYLSRIAGSSQRRLRVFGDMTWTMDKRWRSEGLRELEEKVNISPVTNMLFLCQYKLGRFSGKEAMLAIETHSHYVYRSLLKESPYHSQRRPRETA